PVKEWPKIQSRRINGLISRLLKGKRVLRIGVRKLPRRCPVNRLSKLRNAQPLLCPAKKTRRIKRIAPELVEIDHEEPLSNDTHRCRIWFLYLIKSLSL